MSDERDGLTRGELLRMAEDLERMARDLAKRPPRERFARDLFDAREAYLVSEGKLDAPREWQALTELQRFAWLNEADTVLGRLMDLLDATGEP